MTIPAAPLAMFAARLIEARTGALALQPKPVCQQTVAWFGAQTLGAAGSRRLRFGCVGARQPGGEARGQGPRHSNSGEHLSTAPSKLHRLRTPEGRRATTPESKTP